jgi:uncharacterized protein YjbJ (UPF0337 family)
VKKKRRFKGKRKKVKGKSKRRIQQVTTIEETKAKGKSKEAKGREWQSAGEAAFLPRGDATRPMGRYAAGTPCWRPF